MSIFDRFRKTPSEPVYTPSSEGEAREPQPQPLFNITKNKGDDSSTVWMLLGGRSMVTDSTNPHFTEIVARLTTGTSSERYADVDTADLFNPEFTLRRQFALVSDRVAVANGKVYFDGEEVSGALSSTILATMEQGGDFKPLVNFMERLFDNPNPNSREQLFPWLAKGGFSIDHDGYLLAYKGVRVNEEDGLLYSTFAGDAIVDGVEYTDSLIPNYIGATVWMPREDVDPNSSMSCSTGLHAGRWNYASAYGQVMLVRINPRDVVSVPSHDTEKIRCCRYTVVATETEGPLESVIADSVSLAEVASDALMVTR